MLLLRSLSIPLVFVLGCCVIGFLKTELLGRKHFYPLTVSLRDLRQGLAVSSNFMPAFEWDRAVG